MADFALCGTTVNESLGINTGSGAALGTLVTTSATIHTKGSYSQLAASTSFDSSGLLVCINRVDGNMAFCVDIAIGGAGSEVIIAADLYARAYGNSEINARYYLPIRVPAGSRISARAKSDTTGAQTCYVSVVSFGGGLSQYPTFSGVDLITTTSISTSVLALHNLNGTINVKGSWVQHIASTSREYKAILIHLTPQCSSGANAFALVDLAIGGAGSEQAFMTDLPVVLDLTSGGKAETIGPIPVALASGVRVSSRVLFSASNANNYVILGLYGLY